MLWEGEIGLRFGPNGAGIGPVFASDEYRPGGEEKITALYNPLNISGSLLDIDESAPYRQSLDMRSGLLATKYRTKTGGSAEVLTALDPNGAVAQRYTYQGKPNEEFSVLAVCSDNGVPNGAKDPRDTTWTLLPSGKPVRIRWSCDAPIQDWQFVSSGVRLTAKTNAAGRVTLERLAEFRTSPNAQKLWTATFAAQGQEVFPDVPENHWAYMEYLGNRKSLSPFDTVLASAKVDWKNQWQTDIEIDGPVEDQQAVRSFLFYLRSAVPPSGQVSPFGLSNSQYNGHVFWDADIWVFPALALVDPKAAKRISEYRLERQAKAEKNFQEWLGKGRPTANGKLGPYPNARAGVKYPWESSITGKETVLGPSQFEEHITGDVALSFIQSAALGLIPEKRAREVAALAAHYYVARSTPNGHQLQMPQVMSPDENHIGDNDLYTNALADWTRQFSDPEPWPYKLPRDDKTFLTYDDDPLKSYKQAAAVLAIYPLQYPQAEKEARLMMERFADKTSKNGPAMSDSLHALIWARLGETDKAYETWERSWRDFTNNPFLLFSEKRNKPVTYFTTGAAGCLQTVIYGFLGFRIDSRAQDGAKWSIPLALGRVLSVKPNLPKAWKSVKFKNFTVLGSHYTLIATHTDVRVIKEIKH